MSNIATAGYVVADGDLIHGMGATAAAAWADAEETLRMAGIPLLEGDETYDDYEDERCIARSDLTAWPASAALLRSVEDHGGAKAWRVRDGVAMTVDEADAG